MDNGRTEDYYEYTVHVAREQNDIMEKNLTICIPTCGRPDKLGECVESIRAGGWSGYPIVVLDSAPSDNLRCGYRDSRDITVITKDTIVGPGEARRTLAEHVHTPYLLFLDDDLIPLPNSIDSLHREIEANPNDIFGGIWREGDGFREAGQIFIDGRDTDGQAVISKKFLTVEECRAFGMRKVRVDGCMASLAVSKSTLKRVNFDSSYRFYYELFDFFLQCRAQGTPVSVITNSEFRHNPGDYTSTTNRDLSREHDKNYFQSRWGLRIEGGLGGDDRKPDDPNSGKGYRRLWANLFSKHKQRHK